MPKDINVHLEKLPDFIAIKYQEMLNSDSPEEKIRCGLETFELCLRLITIIMVSQYLIRDKDQVSDPHLNKLLVEKFRIGVLQDWHDVFITALKVYEGHPDWLFMPSIYEMYWDTSNPGRHIPKNNFERMLSRLLILNNDWRDKKNLPETKDKWNDLASEVHQNVIQLVCSLSFPDEYFIIQVNDINENTYLANQHMGLRHVNIEFNCDEVKLQPNWYYLSKGNCDFLLLEPLLTTWKTEHETTAVFRRMTRYDQLLYWLALFDKEQVDDHNRDRFISLLSSVEVVKRAIRSKEQITWLQLTEASKEISDMRMTSIRARYDENLYVQRHQALESFKDFLKSDKRCFVMAGKSGAGKSNFVVALQEELLAEVDLCTLTLDASQIIFPVDLEENIRKLYCNYWGIDGKDFQNIWATINKLEMTEKTFLLVLDGINENDNPVLLLRQVNELLQQPWNWLKILITTRPETWQRMCYGQHLAETMFYQPTLKGEGSHNLVAHNLDPFDRNEVQIAYSLYKTKYKLLNPYDELSSDIRELIREPLQLWMIAHTYESKNIPRLISRYSLIDDYLSALIETGRLERDDVRFLQEKLVPLFLTGKYDFINVITSDVLDKAGSNLIDKVFNGGQYSSGEKVNDSFQRLVDVNIINIKERGMHPKIAFKYERFFDHFVGNFVFQNNILNANNQLQECRSLIDSIERHPFIWGVIERTLMLTIGKYPTIMVKLSFTENLNLVYLISKVIEGYAVLENEKACLILDQITSQSLDSKNNHSLIQKLNAIEVALRVAREINYNNALRQVLLCKNRKIQDVGIKYLYYLNKSNQDLAIGILEAVSLEVSKPFIWVNIPALQATFRTAPLLILDCYQRGKLNDEKTKQVVTIFKNTIHGVVNKSLARIMRPIIKGWIIQAFVKFFVDTARQKSNDASKPNSTINNLDEYRRFFSQSNEIKEQAIQAIEFLNRNKGNETELSNIVISLYKTRDRMSETIGDYIADGHGINSPQESARLLSRALDEIPPDGNVLFLFLTARWYTVMDRQSQVSASSLELMRKFVVKWLNASSYGYGACFRYGIKYQYHPLNSYSALWTRAFPGEQVDLLLDFIKKYEETQDEELLLHIIDTFGDIRHPLYDYRTALRILSPYLEMSGKIREHLVTSLGTLRGLYPLEVDHFLAASDAPKKLVQDIRTLSYQMPSSELYMRFSQLLADIAAYAPIEFVDNIASILKNALSESSFEKMAAVLFTELLNQYALEEQK